MIQITNNGKGYTASEYSLKAYSSYDEGEDLAVSRLAFVKHTLWSRFLAWLDKYDFI